MYGTFKLSAGVELPPWAFDPSSFHHQVMVERFKSYAENFFEQYFGQGVVQVESLSFSDKDSL